MSASTITSLVFCFSLNDNMFTVKIQTKKRSTTNLNLVYDLLKPHKLNSSMVCIENSSLNKQNK